MPTVKLPTRIRYGSRAMVDLALRRSDGPVPLETLARRQGIPRRYLAKIIQDLRRSGLIRSVRGAGGGYGLGRAPADVSMLDIWEALEGEFWPTECLADPSCCEMLPDCVTRDVWARLREEFVAVLGAVTLADLARRHSRKKGRSARETARPAGGGKRPPGRRGQGG